MEDFLKFVTTGLYISWGDQSAESLEDDNIEGRFAILADLFGPNKRHLFTALSDLAGFIIHHFPRRLDELLEKMMIGATTLTGKDSWFSYDGSDGDADIERLHYLVVEALILESLHADFRENRYIDTFPPDNEGVPHYERKEIRRRDYIFNVFKHPFNRSKLQAMNVFATIRAMQFLKFSGNIVTREELHEFLISHFQYDSQAITATIDELLDNGILHYTRNTLMRPSMN